MVVGLFAAPATPKKAHSSGGLRVEEDF